MFNMFLFNIWEIANMYGQARIQDFTQGGGKIL